MEWYMVLGLYQEISWGYVYTVNIIAVFSGENEKSHEKPVRPGYEQGAEENIPALEVGSNWRLKKVA
jgi:hypothetical protein